MSFAMLALSLSIAANAFADLTSDLAKARASDPNELKWMVGTPPLADKILRYEDNSFYTFPQWRWSFSHWREFRPTVEVDRGSTAVSPLPSALRSDLDAVTFTPMGAASTMTWADSLTLNYTDGILVMHKGKVVYERYFGALKQDQPHIAFSVTKSFFGTVAAMLVADGSLDPEAKVARYIPELASSGFGDATVRQVLDMTTAIDFTENYVGDSPTMIAYRNATAFAPRPMNYAGPKSIYAYLPTIAKKGTHGEAFTYRTPNVDVVGWLIARVTGKSPPTVLSEKIWTQIGAEDDAFLQVDDEGTPLVGSSLNLRLRDLARFGELMRLRGKFNGRQIIPTSVIDDIRRGASKQNFSKAGYATLPGWSYRNLWWISHDDHGAFTARGIHGQAIYVDPKAEMVIVRFASHPLAGNANLDPTSLPAYRAIADHLMKK
jgi:CubicO group peptidase (beta-lactamase class C family)